MKKGLAEGLKELGKHLLNIGVAIIVFSIIQPIMNGNFKTSNAILFIITYFILMIVGTIFIIVGSNEHE